MTRHELTSGSQQRRYILNLWVFKRCMWGRRRRSPRPRQTRGDGSAEPETDVMAWAATDIGTRHSHKRTVS